MTDIRNKFTGKQDKPKPIQGDSLTQQHMSESTDINNMVKRYTQGGQINLNKRQPTFGIASAADFHTMQNAVADVRTQFNNLPSRLRSKFQNDPHMLLRWLENPANHDQAVKLGLIPPPVEEFDPDRILQAHADLDAQREREERGRQWAQDVKDGLKSDKEANPFLSEKRPSTEAGNAGNPA